MKIPGEVKLKRVGDVWFYFGVKPDGTISFTGFHCGSFREAVGKVGGRVSPKISEVEEEVFRMLFEAYQGLGVKRLPKLDWGALKPFTRKVLQAVLKIPRGRVTSYGVLAWLIGFPRAARAVGTALASNPFPLLVPCHRVVRGDLTLGGYSLGLEAKVSLLRREGVGFSRAGGLLRIAGKYFLGRGEMGRILSHRGVGGEVG